MRSAKCALRSFSCWNFLGLDNPGIGAIERDTVRHDIFPDAKLKRKSRRCQEALRWRLQIDRIGSEETHTMKTLAMLVATTTLTAAISVTAWSAMRTPAGADGRPFAAVFENGQEALPLVFVSNDDDDDRHHRRSGHGHDDHDDDDHDDDDDDDDDGGNGGRSPAPAGTVAPPQNELFGTGAPPQIKMN
jgi:hypothetical protein